MPWLANPLYAGAIPARASNFLGLRTVHLRENQPAWCLPTVPALLFYNYMQYPIKTCSRCKKVFIPSSKHKCCPKCRRLNELKPCSICGTKLTRYGRCLTCVNKSRIGSGRGCITRDGYRVIKTKDGRRMYEHQYVMEKILGRPLRRGETVHHKYGIKDDNRPDRLELWSSSHPKGQRVSDLVSWAKEIIKLYGDLAHSEEHRTCNAKADGA